MFLTHSCSLSDFYGQVAILNKLFDEECLILGPVLSEAKESAELNTLLTRFFGHLITALGAASTSLQPTPAVLSPDSQGKPLEVVEDDTYFGSLFFLMDEEPSNKIARADDKVSLFYSRCCNFLFSRSKGELEAFHPNTATAQ